MSKLTPAEREEIKDFAAEIVAAAFKAAVPHLIEVISAAKSDVRYSRLGDHCLIEPAKRRDFRKELWVDAYMHALGNLSNDQVIPLPPQDVAAAAVRRFDEAFPE